MTPSAPPRHDAAQEPTRLVLRKTITLTREVILTDADLAELFPADVARDAASLTAWLADPHTDDQDPWEHVTDSPDTTTTDAMTLTVVER